MELVEIDQLEEGDHILISCQSYFKYLIVLKKPQLGKKVHWHTNKPLYKSVKCSVKRDTVTKSYTNYRGDIKTYDEHIWQFTDTDHNFIQYVNLDYRQIIRINR